MDSERLSDLNAPVLPALDQFDRLLRRRAGRQLTANASAQEASVDLDHNWELVRRYLVLAFLDD